MLCDHSSAGRIAPPVEEPMFRRRDKDDAPRVTAEAAPAVDGEVLDDEADEQLDEQVEDQPEDMTADLQSQAEDYMADNDAWMYGPNAEAVLLILDRLEEIVPDEARPLVEAWLAVPKSDRDRARKAAQKLGESDPETGRYLQMAREAVGAWAAVTGPYPEYVNAEPNWGKMCAQTAEAALDAATAVILEGTIEDNHYENLFEPWSTTMAELDEAAELAAATDGDEAAEQAEAEESSDDGPEGEGEFGPNTDSVTDFLNRLWLLGPEQVGRLVSGWQNADKQALKDAHEGLKAAVEEDPEWRDQVRRAQDKLGPWLNAGRIEETAGFLGQSGQGESRKMAGPALADAMAALVLGDILDRPAAEALYGAWFNLVGAPPLPVAQDEEADTNPGK
jgi:hypothetical protein